jgi:hypothetical protein
MRGWGTAHPRPGLEGVDEEPVRMTRCPGASCPCGLQQDGSVGEVRGPLRRSSGALSRNRPQFTGHRQLQYVAPQEARREEQHLQVLDLP